MYIVKTTTRDEIKIDQDELLKIEQADDNQLIYFRQGAVLKRVIAVVVEDPERGRDTPRDMQTKKPQENKLNDIFPQLRNNYKRLT